MNVNDRFKRSRRIVGHSGCDTLVGEMGVITGICIERRTQMLISSAEWMSVKFNLLIYNNAAQLHHYIFNLLCSEMSCVFLFDVLWKHVLCFLIVTSCRVVTLLPFIYWQKYFVETFFGQNSTSTPLLGFKTLSTPQSIWTGLTFQTQ